MSVWCDHTQDATSVGLTTPSPRLLLRSTEEINVIPLGPMPVTQQERTMHQGMLP